MWLALFALVIIYFRLVCLQLQGLLGQNYWWIGPLFAILLVVLALGMIATDIS